MEQGSPPGVLGLSEGLGPLPEAEELDWNRHAEPVFGYTRQQMEAERQRCYALGVAAERERIALRLRGMDCAHVCGIGEELAALVRRA